MLRSPFIVRQDVNFHLIDRKYILNNLSINALHGILEKETTYVTVGSFFNFSLLRQRIWRGHLRIVLYNHHQSYKVLLWK